MTKHFYHCHIDAVHQAAANQHFKEWHYFHVDDQHVILTAKFSHEGMELHFRKSHPSIDPFPHMLSRRKVNPKHIEKLNAHIATLDGGAPDNFSPDDSTFDVAEKLSAHYPLHGPEAF